MHVEGSALKDLVTLIGPLSAYFYSLNVEGKNPFIAEHVVETKKKCEKVRRNDRICSRRKYSRQYFLPKACDKVEVCQMFINTFDPTLNKIRDIVEKRRACGSGIYTDN